MKGQFSRFLTVGAFNTVLGYAVIFSAMYGLGFSPELSNAIGYAVGFAFSFVLSKVFTFRSVGKPSAELVRFLIVFLVAYSANLITLYILIHSLSFHEGFSQLLAGVIYILFSYLLNSRYVFTQSTRSEG